MYTLWWDYGMASHRYQTSIVYFVQIAVAAAVSTVYVCFIRFVSFQVSKYSIGRHICKCVAQVRIRCCELKLKEIERAVENSFFRMFAIFNLSWFKRYFYFYFCLIWTGLFANNVCCLRIKNNKRIWQIYGD